MNPAASPSPSQPGCDGKAGALLPPDSAPADLTFGAFTVRDGKILDDDGRIYWPALCWGMLRVYERDAKAGDWWSPQAARRHNDLADAMEAAGLFEEQAA